jgi:lysophospholipase L1-like esterase
MSRLKILILTLLGIILLSGCQNTSLKDYQGSFDPDPERFAEAIAAYEASDRESMPPEGAILATGSSSMRMWQNRIHEDLAGLTVIPRGFGGSHFSDVIYYAERIIFPYNPRAILIYEGDNDTSHGKSAETVLADMKFLIDYCRSELPDVRFYIISVKPSVAREAIWPIALEANSLMKDYCDSADGVTYIDVAAPLLGEDGSARDDIFIKDMLHLNQKGYDIWADAIAPVLQDAEGPYEGDAN